MSGFFLKIVNMSISAGWLVLVVLALRFILKKAPKWVYVLLWGIVAIRLICPVSIESALSLIPSRETISPEIMMDWTPEISTGIASLDRVVNPVISTSFAPKPWASANPLQILIPIAANIWILGILAMASYTAATYITLRLNLRTAVILRDHIFQCETVQSPFVLGVLKPKIYLPYTLGGQDLDHVIAHEQAHISRKDHWWKPLGFALLAVHWFNPLMWLAYILMCRDIELACDEKVIAKLGSGQRADYTQALVRCSVNRRMIAACPLAFGEVGVKERVKSIMNYRKPGFWLILAALVICAVVAVCFLTDPVTSVRNPWVQEYVPGAAGILGSVDKEKYESVSEDFAIGADQYGRAVFKDPHRAFDTLLVLYADGIALIQEEFHLPPLTPLTAGVYKLYGWQTSEGSSRAMFVSGFLDLYENSFTKDTPAAENEPITHEATEPIESHIADPLEAAISEAIDLQDIDEQPDGVICCESHVILGNEVMSGTPLFGETDHAEKITVYLLVYRAKYSPYGGTLEEVGGSLMPTALTFDVTESGDFVLAEYWEPGLGADYARDIRDKFPGAAAEDALNAEGYVNELKAECDRKALAYLDSVGSLEGRIEALLQQIQSSPLHSSNPGDYIREHPEEYDQLFRYGEFTLRYCFTEFLRGSQTDLRGHIMALLCQDIMAAWGEAYTMEGVLMTGQDWFDEFAGNAQALSAQISMEEIAKHYPGACLYLQMI